MSESKIVTLSADKCSLKSLTDSLTNTRLQATCIASLEPAGDASRNKSNQKTSLLLSARRNKTFQKEKSQYDHTINACLCSDCATVQDVPKHLLQKLEDEVETLQSGLTKQRNDNLVLKRHLLVAKKVIKNEIGLSRGENFDSLWKKSSGYNWKGRHEKISDLKRKLRHLSEAVERIECETQTLPSSNRVKRKREKSPEWFPDERTLYWCLELERREVWRNAERYKQKIITSRNAMKDKLEPLIARNEKLIKEVASLREKLSTDSKSSEEGLVKRLPELESKVKTLLEEKSEERQKLDDMERQICRNNKLAKELKTMISLEKSAWKLAEANIKSLKAKESILYTLSEEAMKEKCKQSFIFKKKLEEVKQNFSKTITKSEKVIDLMTNGKQHLKKLKSLFIKDCVDIKQSRTICQVTLKNPEAKNQLHVSNGSEQLIFCNSTVHMYENKLLRYKSVLENLENRNRDKLRKLNDIVREMEDQTMSLLKNHGVISKLTANTIVLMGRFKRCRKAILNPTKLKMAKKKDSNQQLVQFLDERRISLAIRENESKFLRALIRSVYCSKEDESTLLVCFLGKNRHNFLKASSKLKV